MGQTVLARAWARWVLVSGFGLCWMGSVARAEDRPGVVGTLPDAPSFAQAQSAPPPSLAQASEPEGTASISGFVLDVHGEPVAGAKVTLSAVGGKSQQVQESDVRGQFHFLKMAPATVRVTVTAPGLETFISDEIHLAAGEQFELPRIEIPLAPLNSDVTVTVTADQLATEQVHEQEKQRVLGVIPNFYTSYLWDAAPMHKKQKAQLAFRSILDPFVFFVVGVRAGVEQVRNTDPGYGDGVAGYARRYGAAYGDSITGRVIGQAILPGVFHQDPRYFYMGTGSTGRRVWYALTRAVVTRGDNGRNQPNYSHVLGNFAAAGLRNLYLDPDDRKGRNIVLNGVVFTGYNALTNVIREFVSRPLSSHVPDYKKGKPEDQ